MPSDCTRAAFDDVIDFDQVVRDWADPNLTSAPFNCGDSPSKL
jgi:hypothetical protein